MRSVSALASVVVVCAIVGTPAAQQRAAQGAFHLSSADVKTSFAPAQIANTFGCSGGNVSPQLSWTGAPVGTKSFAITLYDSRCPDGVGLVALGGREHSGVRHAAGQRREPGQDASGHDRNAHRLR